MTLEKPMLSLQNRPFLLFAFGGDGFGWFLELVENIKIEVIILSFASGTLHAGLFLALLPDRKTS